jgi:hypothetical protein
MPVIGACAPRCSKLAAIPSFISVWRAVPRKSSGQAATIGSLRSSDTGDFTVADPDTPRVDTLGSRQTERSERSVGSDGDFQDSVS